LPLLKSQPSYNNIISYPLAGFRVALSIQNSIPPPLWRIDPIPCRGLILRGLTITHTGHITIGWTPLDEWPVRFKDPYLTTHNTHKRQTSMHPAGFWPQILGSGGPQIRVLDRAVTGIRIRINIHVQNNFHLYAW